jgi:hypothetical protein
MERLIIGFLLPGEAIRNHYLATGKRMPLQDAVTAASK